MSGFSSLFSGLNFRNTIQKYASHHGWRVAEVDNDHALLRFSMQSGQRTPSAPFRCPRWLIWRTAFP